MGSFQKDGPEHCSMSIASRCLQIFPMNRDFSNIFEGTLLSSEPTIDTLNLIQV